MQVTLGDHDITDYVDPEDGSDEALQDAFRHQFDWDTSGAYEGWIPAGVEAWMRKGYRDGEPVIVEKTGNADSALKQARMIEESTLKRGRLLEELGANIVPTCMIVDEESLENGEDGIDCNIYQEFITGPLDDITDVDQRDAIDFRTQYAEGALSDHAIRQFAENCAAIDTAGFEPTNDGRAVHRDFLTEGDECYLVDFGCDLGRPGQPLRDRYDLEPLSTDELAAIQQNWMRESGYRILDEPDRALFEDTYDTARASMLSTYADSTDLDWLMEAQYLSADERRYLETQVG